MLTDGQVLHSHFEKNTDIITLTEQLVHRLGGGRITSCKSAKVTSPARLLLVHFLSVVPFRNARGLRFGACSFAACFLAPLQAQPRAPRALDRAAAPCYALTHGRGIYVWCRSFTFAIVQRRGFLL